MATVRKKVFISFSGEKSKKIALALKTWLSLIFREIDFVVSSSDIRKGVSWSPYLNELLRRSIAGILCVTRDNCTKPWLMFEAGALIVKRRSAVPFILDENPAEINAFLQNTPLGTLQPTSYCVIPGEKHCNRPWRELKENRKELKNMVFEINLALKEQAYKESDLNKILDNQYEYLENALQEIADGYPGAIPALRVMGNPSGAIPEPQDIFTLYQDWAGKFSEATERERREKRELRALLEEILNAVQSGSLSDAIENLKSHINDKNAGHEQRLIELGERLEGMERSLKQSTESRQRIAFHMGRIHELFLAVSLGLDVLDEQFSGYHDDMQQSVIQVRDEIFSCLKGDILTSLDSVTEKISETERNLGSILNAAAAALHLEGEILPDDMKIFERIALSAQSLDDIRAILTDICQEEVSVQENPAFQ